MNGNPLRTYWPQLAAIVLVSVAWGANVTRIANAEDELADQDDRIEAIEKDLGDVKVAVTKIDTNQMHIQRDVSEINDTLTEILRELREN